MLTTSLNETHLDALSAVNNNAENAKVKAPTLAAMITSEDARMIQTAEKLLKNADKDFELKEEILEASKVNESFLVWILKALLGAEDIKSLEQVVLNCDAFDSRDFRDRNRFLLQKVNKFLKI